MPIWATIVFLAIGFCILLYAGDCLVRGALAAALKTRISPLLVGVLVVGFGTSLPELMIGVRAAMEGSTGLAHGDIVGSNIANIWLVLAVPTILFPAVTGAPRMRITVAFMLLVTLAWIGLTWFYGLNPAIGAGALALLAAYAIVSLIVVHRDTERETPDETELEHTPFMKMAMLILIGIVGLPLGAQILIEAGIKAGAAAGLTQEAVGLTILAVGSSLPELGAGLAAGWRKESEVALGNIIGANIFNILGVGGAVALIGPQKLSIEFHNYSHWAMALSALMLTLVVLFQRRIGWLTAVVFLSLYAAYLLGLIYNWTLQDLPCLVVECPAR